MPYIDVDTAVELFVNILPLTSDSDFTTRDTGVAYNEAGMDLVWNFITTAGVITQTAITPTNTGGDYDWTHVGDGMYKIELPASGGASANNDREGTGWFSGIATGVLSWVSPLYTFRAAALNNALIDGGDELDVNVTQIGGDTQSATDLKDFADAGYDPSTNKVQGVVLTDTVTTYTGNTPQTGDSYAIVNHVTYGNSAINTKLGTPSDLGNGATVAFNLSDIHTDTAAIDAIASKLSGLVMASEVIGSTGNSTTAVHLSTLTYGNDEINDHLLVIYDNSTGEFHSRWITDWVNSTKLATVATLPFTPENAVDTYYLTSIRRDMTAATVSDKTGYSISGTTTTFDALQTALNSAHGAGSWATATGFSTHSAADVWAAGTRTLTAATNISGPIADQVWEEALGDHSATAGSTAEALAAAGGAGDPWITPLPGSYTSGQAGKIVGDYLNATVSSRASQTSVDTIDGIVDAILLDTAEIGAAGAGLTAIQLPSNGLANVTAWTVAITGNITGNLSGSVGSVTGAVGSVTGNVGGNVTGSVGSVLGGINTTAGVITTLDGLDTAQDTQHSTTQGLVTTVDTVVDSILVDTTQIKADLPTRITKNTELAAFPFVMVLSSDHVTGATSKTVTATRSIDGGAFASCANAVTEIANGWYKITLAAADLNGNTIALRFTATDCDDRVITIVTQP